MAHHFIWYSTNFAIYIPLPWNNNMNWDRLCQVWCRKNVLCSVERRGRVARESSRQFLMLANYQRLAEIMNMHYTREGSIVPGDWISNLLIAETVNVVSCGDCNYFSGKCIFSSVVTGKVGPLQRGLKWKRAGPGLPHTVKSWTYQPSLGLVHCKEIVITQITVNKKTSVSWTAVIS